MSPTTKRSDELLQDGALRTEMGGNARSWAAQFDWTSAGQRFAEVLVATRH